MEISEQAKQAAHTILAALGFNGFTMKAERVPELVQLAITSALQEKAKEFEAYEHEIINLSIKGTDETQFESVGEMQVALLHKEVVALRSTVEELRKFAAHPPSCHFAEFCTCGLSKLLSNFH